MCERNIVETIHELSLRNTNNPPYFFGGSGEKQCRDVACNVSTDNKSMGIATSLQNNKSMDIDVLHHRGVQHL